MVRIRLRRVGAKKQASYRIVATEKESPRDGRFLEVLGNYNPRTQPETIHLEEDRIFHWLSVGAQPSDSVNKLLSIMGTLERYERFKAGEDVGKLMEEAASSEAARDVNPKTTYVKKAGKKAKKTEKVEEYESEE